MSIASCAITLVGDLLIADNDVIERRWRVTEGTLIPLSLRIAGREWLVASDQAGSVPPLPLSGMPQLTVERARRYGVEAEGLHGALRWGDSVLTISVFPGIAAVTLQWSGIVDPGARSSTHDDGPSGVEVDEAAPAKEVPERDRCEMFTLVPPHLHLHTVRLMDRTDVHDNLAQAEEWRLARTETITRRGCVFAIEDPLTRAGLILLKHAPLPHARPAPNAVDLRCQHRTIALLGHGAGDTGNGYAWSVIGYTDGAAGRCVALQALQRCLRPYVPGRDGRFLSNTWGDRNRDGRINEAFIATEIQAGKGLGVDVVQIDDGWQKGITANSVHSAKGGVWLGFWAADAHFWHAHPERFPRGLASTAVAVGTANMGFGLWFAPDSADDFANWQRDADAVLALHREHGVNYVKIDGVKAHTKRSEANLWNFFRTVLEATSGAVVFDLDVTAETRPGYFGMMAAGPLFVENRYTDWHRYWPHATLRNLWQLSWWVDPTRLRIEFLNHLRNADKYGDDPLAPARYSPTYLFAMTMIANPLGWFETSSLPPATVAEIAPLVALWKQHRDELHSGSIVPIGETPDGTQWTGFCSQSPGIIHLLIFRELTPHETFAVPLSSGHWRPAVVYGSAEITHTFDSLVVAMADPLGFAWIRLVAAAP